MSAATQKSGQRIDTLMEEASADLGATLYFAAERKAAEALRMAHAAGDYDRMARILLPLQEARRQKRLLAIDAGAVHVLDRSPRLEEPEGGVELIIRPGCWLVAPPLVGADGRELRRRADDDEIPVLVVVREPETREGLWPIVMVGPSTIRTKVRPVRDPTPAWFLATNEALGDAAIAEVDATLPAVVRVERLMDRLLTVPEHEKLHQALAQACLEAEREGADGAGPGRGRPAARRARKGADPHDETEE